MGKPKGKASGGASGDGVLFDPIPLEPQATEAPTAAQTSESTIPTVAPAAPVDRSGFTEDETSPIIDRTTGKRVRVPEHLLNAAVMQNAVGYAPEHRVNVVGQDGKSINVGGDYLKYALTQGYNIETTKQQVGREFAAQHKGLDGTALTALGNFVDNAAFDIPGMIFNKYGDEYDIAKRDALVKEHKIASDIGGVAGFGTSLLYGGELTGASKAAAFTERAILKAPEVAALATRLGEAGVVDAAPVAASLGRQMLAKAAATGVEGVVLSAPTTITEAALGDPEKAGEHLLENFGAGAALGGVGKLIGAGVAKGAQAIAPHLGEMAEQQAFKSLMYSKNAKAAEQALNLPGGIKAVGRTALDEGLIKDVGESFSTLADRAETRRKEVGEKIGNLYGQLDGIDSKVKLSSAEDLANQFRDKVIEPMRLPGNEGVVAKLEAYAKSFETLGADKPMTFDTLHSWRSALDDKIWNEGQIGITDKADKGLNKIRNLIQNELETKGDQVAKSAGMDFKTQLDQNNLLYRKLKVIEKTSAKSAVQEESNRALSPSDYGTGLAVGAGMLAHGNILGAIGAGGASIAHKFVRENGNGLIAKALDAAGFSAKGNKLLQYGLENGASSQAGLLMAERAMKNGGEELDKIPGLLARMSASDIPRQTVIRGATRLAQDLAMAKHADQVSQNPQQLEQNVKHLSSVISDQGAPEIGKAYAAKQRTAAQYILDNLPKTPPSDPYKPSSPKIPASAASSFSRKLEVAENPYAVLKHIEDGTLTKDHVEAAWTCYPKIMGEIIKRADAHAYDVDSAPLGFRARQGITLLRGGDPAAAQPAITPTVLPGAAPPKQKQLNFQQVLNQKSAPAPKKLGKTQFANDPMAQANDFSRVLNSGIGSKR